MPTLRKLAQHLAPDGRLYLTTPDPADHGKLVYFRSYRDIPMPRKSDQPPVDGHIDVAASQSGTS